MEPYWIDAYFKRIQSWHRWIQMMPWRHLQILADVSYQNMKRLLVIWYLNCPDSVNNGSFFIIFLKIFRFIPLHLFHWLKLRKFRYFNDKIILFFNHCSHIPFALSNCHGVCFDVQWRTFNAVMTQAMRAILQYLYLAPKKL